MRKSAIAFAAFAACAAFGANVAEILNEDFGKGADSAVFKNGIANSKVVKPADGGVFISCEDKKTAFKVGPLKHGAVYLYKFKYRLNARNVMYPLSVSLCDEKGKIIYGPNPVANVPSINLTAKDGFRAPSEGGKYFIYMNAVNGGGIFLDDLRIWEIIPDKTNSYLFCEPHYWHNLFADKTFPGMYFSPTAYAFLDPHSPILDMPKEKFFPFVDKWGQYKYSEWTNKIKSDAELKASAENEAKYYESVGDIKGRDKYGALENSRGDFTPTGRFCLDKIGGKWILRAPNGNVFWAFGMNSVGINSSTVITDREHFFEDLSDAKKYAVRVTSPQRGYPEDARPVVYQFLKRNFFGKYGLETNEQMFAKTKELADIRLKKWGLNSYGAWAAPKNLENPRLPYIAMVDSPKTLTKSRGVVIAPDASLRKLFRTVPDTFDKRFDAIVDASVKAKLPQLKSEYCIGLFIDNEVPWETKDGYTAEAVLTCPAEQPAKIAFADALKKQYGEISKLNAAWGADYADWEAVLLTRSFIPKTDAAKKDLLDFDFAFHARYYQVCRDAMKKYAPDVLYFGSRFAWRNTAAVKAAAKYCDVVSFNLYLYDIADFKMPDAVKNKPIIIGEFSMSRSDYGHFWKGPKPVANGEEQSAMLENFLIGVLKHPNFIGASWFQYYDQPTTGRTDGENASFGVLDICDIPHYDLIETMRKISQKMYDIRLEKGE